MLAMKRYQLYKQKKEALVAQGADAKQEDVKTLIYECHMFALDLQADVSTAQLCMEPDCKAKEVLTWIEELKEIIK